MTDQALMEELRDMGEHPSRADLPMGRTLRDAADRIEALCRAIEKHETDKAAHAATVEGILNSHEAFRQKVSDAVEHCRACSDPEAWTRIKFELDRFIIPEPSVDPLVEALNAMWRPLGAEPNVCEDEFDANDAAKLREALAKRGLKIVETGQ